MAAPPQLSIFDAEYCDLDSSGAATSELRPRAGVPQTGGRNPARRAARFTLVIHTNPLPVDTLPMKMRSE